MYNILKHYILQCIGFKSTDDIKTKPSLNFEDESSSCTAPNVLPHM